MSYAREEDPQYLRAALALAQRGLPVFPLQPVHAFAPGRFVCGCGTLRCGSPGKHPLARLVPKGLLGASVFDNVITHWWLSIPTANIGLRTDTVIVLDVDPRHGGDISLARLEEKHGGLPATWRVETGGGGSHLYFQASGRELRNSAGLLGPGLDIRAVGGYVVAPPSLHISGRRYAWAAGCAPDELQSAALPSWILELLVTPASSSARGSSDWRGLVTAGAREGKRNVAITKLSGHLLRHYVDPRVAHELLQAWNAARCDPPLDPAEVTRTVASIARKELRRREARDG